MARQLVSPATSRGTTPQNGRNSSAPPVGATPESTLSILEFLERSSVIIDPGNGKLNLSR
jgi:hypothetical protein